MTEKIADEYIRKLPSATAEEVSPRNELYKLILGSSNLDDLLYLTQKRYRDHYKHQFLVGSLGWFLLDVILPSGETLKAEMENLEGVHCLSNDDIDQAWWCAALLHDHGYPLSHILKSIREINDLKGEFDHGNEVLKGCKVSINLIAVSFLMNC